MNKDEKEKEASVGLVNAIVEEYRFREGTCTVMASSEIDIANPVPMSESRFRALFHPHRGIDMYWHFEV